MPEQEILLGLVMILQSQFSAETAEIIKLNVLYLLQWFIVAMKLYSVN